MNASALLSISAWETDSSADLLLTSPTGVFAPAGEKGEGTAAAQRPRSSHGPSARALGPLPPPRSPSALPAGLEREFSRASPSPAVVAMATAPGFPCPAFPLTHCPPGDATPSLQASSSRASTPGRVYNRLGGGGGVGAAAPAVRCLTQHDFETLSCEGIRALSDELKLGTVHRCAAQNPVHHSR